MCDLCRKIVDVKTGFLDALMTKDDFIANENGTIFLYINTGDSGCPGTIYINYCPVCGRKLCDETETPIEHFLKSEIERSKLRMNAYAECFDGVHVDNDTRKKLLESHIRFCKNALKQCMDV